MECLEDPASIGRYFFVIQTLSWNFAPPLLAADGQKM